MYEELVTFKTAVLAKEKGFDWPVPWYGTHQRKSPTNPDSFYPEFSTFKNWNDDSILKYYDRYSLPTQRLLQKWLRDIHKIHVNPSPYIESYDRAVTGYYMGEIINSKGEVLYHGDDNYATYEEALEAGLQTALEKI